MHRVLLHGLLSCQASVLIVAGCARESRELPNAPVALRWSAAQRMPAHRYKANPSRIHEMHPLVFDGRIVERTYSAPRVRPSSGYRKDEVALQVFVVRVLKGRLSMQRFSVAVPDIVSSFPSGPVPIFGQGGVYRFFCDSEKLEHTKSVKAEALCWLTDAPNHGVERSSSP